MRTHPQHILNLAVSKIGLMSLLLAVAVGAAAIPAHAQDGAWKIDGKHSIARLSLGSAPKSVEVGLARISGNVVFDGDDPVVNLTILPENGQAADFSKISFNSKRSALTDDGKLAVIGDLTVTRVERSATLDPNEGYYGAVYGEPVVQTETREVAFLLPAETHPAAQNGNTELSASTHISREYFPQLLSAMAPGNWSNVLVQDEHCTLPSAVGEGYYGAACTGTSVATATNSVAPATAVVGEGYYGSEPAVVPDGGQATIALDLKLVRVAAARSTAPAAAMVDGN
jgi:polyisoprenoid-binding protein YceI